MSQEQVEQRIEEAAELLRGLVRERGSEELLPWVQQLGKRLESVVTNSEEAFLHEQEKRREFSSAFLGKIRSGVERSKQSREGK
ncbi:MAG: hypothetical protein RIC55_28435 [Pirellulaceae bacterium]